MKKSLVILACILLLSTLTSCIPEKVQTATGPSGNNGNGTSDPNHTHSLAQVESKEPTCSEQGWNAYEHCTVCDYTTIEYIAPTGDHVYENEKCSVCGKKEFSEGLEFVENSDGTYALKGRGTCTDSEISIPKTYNGKNVTVIEEGAFQEDMDLVSLTISENIKAIHKKAFKNCKKLERIYYYATNISSLQYTYTNKSNTINFSSTEIFQSAGSEGSGIKVVIGNNVKTVPAYLFCPYWSDSSGNYAPYITSVVFEEDSICTTIGNHAFDNASITQIDIPDSVVYLLGDAFAYSETLETVNFGSGLQHIMERCFHGCPIKEITLPEGFIGIGNFAFSNCKQLEKVTFPSTIKDINQYAFSACSALKEVHVPDVKSWLSIKFVSGPIDASPMQYAEDLYVNGEPLREIVIPEGVDTLTSSMFYGLKNITSITITSGVTYIKPEAFKYLEGLKSLSFESTEGWQVSSGYYSWNNISSTSLSATPTDMKAKFFDGGVYQYKELRNLNNLV